MRKLYALLAGVLLALVLPARTVTPDIANFSYIVDHPNNNVVFTNNSIIGSEPGLRKAFWSFGDGSGTMTPPLQGTQHHYASAGTYTVCLKIYRYRPNHNDSVLTAQMCKTVIIITVCRADFEKIVSPPNNPLLANFRALPHHNNNRKPAKICWEFGDGRDTCINYPENYTGPYVVPHRYNHPGQYEVCVRIIYYGGCEARKCHLITVTTPDICRAGFEKIPSPPNNPLQANFRALPHHNNNRKPARICWEFGDGRDTCINYPENYNGPYIVSHRYNHPGLYEVCVRILYYGGCEAKKCERVQVGESTNCRADFERVHLPDNNPLTIGLKALPWNSNNRKPAKICWDFGDGRDTCINYPENYTGQYIVGHRYNHPGVYEVCVRILYYGGCEATKCREVVIRPLSTVCGGYMMDSLVAPRTLKLKGFSIHNPNDEVLSYRWTFGDGGTAMGREVTHTYSHGGNYEVCLFIKTRLGCETRICKKVRVPGHNQPVLHLSPNPVINVLHAEFLSTHTEQVNITILNASGTVMRNYSKNVIVGPNHWNFELGNLLPGVYSFVLQSPNQLASGIFIKQ